MIKGYLRRRIWAASDVYGPAEYEYQERVEAQGYLESAPLRELLRLYREWVLCK